MFSTFRTLLAASVALPLATGFAFAQGTQPQTAPSTAPAVTATAPAAPSAGPSATASAKTSKELGALKATPAEKKAKQEKTSAVSPSDKTVKTAAVAPKKHLVKKSAVEGSVAGKAATPATAPKTEDGAKKL
jgi:hypothetical protein